MPFKQNEIILASPPPPPNSTMVFFIQVKPGLFTETYKIMYNIPTSTVVDFPINIASVILKCPMYTAHGLPTGY